MDSIYDAIGGLPALEAAVQRYAITAQHCAKPARIYASSSEISMQSRTISLARFGNLP
jgi:hypothetical protein